MNQPSQYFIVVPEISLEQVGNRVLEIDEGRNAVDAGGGSLTWVVHFHLNSIYKCVIEGRESPGLVAMGDDSCSKGSGFESWRRILAGHFSHWFVVKILLFVWKDWKNEKEAGVGPFKNASLKTTYLFFSFYIFNLLWDWIFLPLWFILMAKSVFLHLVWNSC